ncbi:hypothetical protein NL676_005621 [Syzygium grande]|nr:hypothetical protein NL676_005621 [Syzygium grande]
MKIKPDHFHIRMAQTTMNPSKEVIVRRLRSEETRLWKQPKSSREGDGQRCALTTRPCVFPGEVGLGPLWEGGSQVTPLASPRSAL